MKTCLLTFQMYNSVGKFNLWQKKLRTHSNGPKYNVFICGILKIVQLLTMGIQFSAQRKALEEAKAIREELHARVNARKQKFSQVFAQIPEEKKKKIYMSSATELATMLDDGETTSMEMTFCFIQRAATIGIDNNYVIDQLFDEALAGANMVDLERKKSPGKKCWRPGMDKNQCFPPFYGVPISVKQTFLMKGRQTYGGFVSKVNPIPDEQSCFIDIILNMGFIPFVRTNVPQACKTIQTHNHMFGYCKNPWDPSRSTGGSSGGQGGIIAAYSSPFGVGSDIGGSLRVPAQFNGLCTLKAGQRSIARLGNCYYGKYSGGTTVKSQFGALARSVDDLITYSSVMFDPQSYKRIDPIKIDPYLTPTPFNHSLFMEKPKFRVGIAKRLETLTTSQAHLRALDVSSNILKQDGHEVVPIKLPNLQKLYLLLVQMFTCDQKLGIMEELRKSEPVIKQYKLLALMGKIPWVIRKIIIYLIKKKQPRLAKMIEASKPLTVREMFELIYESQTTIAGQMYETFIKNKLDVILLPGFASCAPKLGQMGKLQYCFSFNSSWNAIAYPVGSLPVTTIMRGETQFSDEFNDFYTNGIRSALKDSQGMPVGIQIAACPKKDENILYIMKTLEDKLRFRQKHVCPVLTDPHNHNS